MDGLTLRVNTCNQLQNILSHIKKKIGFDTQKDLLSVTYFTNLITKLKFLFETVPKLQFFLCS